MFIKNIETGVTNTYMVRKKIETGVTNTYMVRKNIETGVTSTYMVRKSLKLNSNQNFSRFEAEILAAAAQRLGTIDLNRQQYIAS
jgi:fructose-specific phosphotransferase system component IIB